MIVRVAYAATDVLDSVDALLATYVDVRPGIVEVPNLQAALLDYYLYTTLQQAPGPTATQFQNFDIRSKRKLRGDRDLMLRITNVFTTVLQIGVSVRYLLTPS